MHRTLVLNANYTPLGTIDWKRAITLIFEGKVELVEEYEDFIVRSPSTTMKVPSVIRVIKWVKAKTIGIRFNKGNVFLRDKGKCQYCAMSISENSSTYDHVFPKSRGGKTQWDNIVTCCYSCNQKKENKTPEEAGMKLLAKPVKPSSLPLEVIFGIRFRNKVPEQWANYIRRQ